MPGKLRFSLLGHIRGWRDESELDLGSPKQRLLLAVLLLHEGRPVPPEVLADALWGDSVPPSATGVIRTYIYRLRQQLGADSTIKTRSGAYFLEADAESVDVGRFRELTGRAEVARREGDLAGAAGYLESALGLWAGAALDGVAGRYAEGQRVRLAGLRASAAELLFTVRLELGEHAEVVDGLRAAVDAEPLRERLGELLMLALYRSGRQAEALLVFENVRQLLSAELGADPGPGLRALHQRILTADTTLLEVGGGGRAPAPAAVPVAVTPRQLPADLGVFVGRGAELAPLVELAGDGSMPSVVTIGGMAGVGKTTLAVRLAHRVAESFPDGQLYVDLRGFDVDGAGIEPAEGLRGFLAALGVPAQRVPEDLAGRSALLRTELAGRRVLIVLDNARDSEQVLPFLPGGPGCLVIVTSRRELPGVVAVAGARVVSLESLSTADARQLLARRIGADRVAAEPAAVDRMVCLCARLPLALAVAAARAAARPAFPLAAVADELGAARGKLDAFAGADRAVNLRAVFSWSMAALSPAAVSLFRLLALHPGARFTPSVAAAVSGTQLASVVPVLAELTSAHLVTERSPGRYSWHDLLRAYAHEELAAQVSSGVRHEALRRLLDHYLHSARAAARLYSTHRDWPSVPDPDADTAARVCPAASYEQATQWFAAEYETLLALLDRATATGFPDHAWRLGWALRHFQDRHGYWHDLATTQRLCMEAADVLGDPTARAYAHRGLARAATLLGEHAEAREHLVRALRLFTELGDDLATAYTHRQIVWVLELGGDLEGGLTHGRAALNRFRAAGVRDGEAGALNSTGWTLALLGDFDQALRYCQSAVELCEELGEQYGKACAVDSLGYVYRSIGDYERSLDSYRQALRLFRTLRARDDEADVLSRLSLTYRAAGQPERARAMLEQSIAIMAELGRPETAEARATLRELESECDGQLAR